MPTLFDRYGLRALREARLGESALEVLGAARLSFELEAEPRCSLLQKARRSALAAAEWEFTQIGRALLTRGKAADALKILRFTTEGATVHDAAGDECSAVESARGSHSAQSAAVASGDGRWYLGFCCEQNAHQITEAVESIERPTNQHR
jgi:hypothetical protein